MHTSRDKISVCSSKHSNRTVEFGTENSPLPQPDPPEEGSADGVGCIALIVVVLEHKASMESRCMIRVMLVLVVWMQCMCHVRTDKEAAPQRALNSTLLSLWHKAGRCINPPRTKPNQCDTLLIRQALNSQTL